MGMLGYEEAQRLHLSIPWDSRWSLDLRNPTEGTILIPPAAEQLLDLRTPATLRLEALDISRFVTLGDINGLSFLKRVRSVQHITHNEHCMYVRVISRLSYFPPNGDWEHQGNAE